MRDLRDLIIILFSVLAVVILLSYWSSKIECKKIAQKLGYECEYSFWAGCIFTDNNGKKFLLEQLRKVEQ